MATPGKPPLRRWAARAERDGEFVLILAGFVMIPLAIGLFFWELEMGERRLFTGLSIAIWALFACHYLLGLWLAADRRSYATSRGGILKLIVIALPAFRVAGLLAVAAYSLGGSANVVRNFGHGILFLAFGVVSIGSTLIYTIDSGGNPAINTYGDALWWTFVTVTTVGYGDTVPAGGWGRGVAVAVMVIGIAIYSGTAAYVSSWLIRSRAATGRANDDAVVEEVAALRGAIERLREEIRNDKR